MFDGSPRLSAFIYLGGLGRGLGVGGVFGDTLVRVSRNCGHFWRVPIIRIILLGVYKTDVRSFLGTKTPKP